MAIPYELLVKEDLNLGYGTVTVTMPAGGTATGNKVGIHTLLGRYYNVKDFGAIGDGIADDTSAVQAAVTQAGNDGGGLVFVPAGTYRISTVITVPDFVNILGAHYRVSLLRATGNNFILKPNTAHQSGFRHLQFDAASIQATGGAIDFTSAGQNISVEDCLFGSNLYWGLYVAPSAGGVYFFRRLRWNGIAHCNTAIEIGNEINLVSSILIQDCWGTAGTQSDMVNWVKVNGLTDTIELSHCGFYRGTNGIVFGSVAALSDTQYAVRGCTVDSMSAIGINVARGVNVQIVSNSIQTNSNGINLAAFATGVVIANNTIQNNTISGIAVQAGAAFFRILGNVISDNNTSNTGSESGIAINANVSNFIITENHIGNSILLATGHQKYGILLVAGTSDHYIITLNHCHNNATSDTVQDGGSGVNKVVANNLTG